MTRKLRLIWKHPETRRYHWIGQFESLQDGRYAFGYRPEAAEVDGFSLLVQFPDLDRTYLSDALPAFFANRVMSRKRRSYRDYLSWLGLGVEEPPMEILARTGGGRATDTFHVVDGFEEIDGRCEGRFFVSGIRHRDEQAARQLRADQELTLVDEPDNPQNPRAILLTAGGTEIGWLPDWLVDTVHDLRADFDTHVLVEQVNDDAPPHLAVLCRLEAQRR